MSKDRKSYPTSSVSSAPMSPPSTVLSQKGGPGKTSTSVRVVVVLPVPPFCDRTVIVVDIGADDTEEVG